MRIIKPIKRRKSSQQGPASLEGGYEVVDAQEVLQRKDSHERVVKKRNSTRGLFQPTVNPMSTKLRRSSPTQPAELSDSGDEPASELQELAASKKTEYSRLFASGVRLLAMREHSVKEIYDKLSKKTESMDMVNGVIDDLLEKRYLSNERFTESYIRSRSNKGFGPIKIRAELKSKGVTDSLIAEHLELGSPVWIDRANSQYQKKYGDGGVSDYNTWTKRARFMQSRGFTMEHIQVALPEIEFD